VRVLRVYHAGRDRAHRARERALVRAGADVTLVVPRTWPGDGDERELSEEPFPIHELAVSRAGDVNRHRYAEPGRMRELLALLRPDVLDIHEEPFSIAGRQWLAAAPPSLPVVMYTAQNVDKRLPPPFAAFERNAHRRVAALYPCSRQAAAVSRGKGFDGLIDVIPLGYDPALFSPGRQSLDEPLITLVLLGRLVPEKGALDAIRVLAFLSAGRSTQLVLAGSGPEDHRARALAESLGVTDQLRMQRWASAGEVAALLRHAHVVLVPSVPTETWTEQFGRVIVEAQASGAVVAGYASGAIPEVGGAGAVLVSPHDVDGLGAAIGALLRDPEDFARRRELGIALSRDRTWGRVAERQLELYARVVSGTARKLLPHSPRRRRELAAAEWGSTAPTTAGRRPFALPGLRNGGLPAAVLAHILDAAAEAAASLGALRRHRASSGS
jgi:glycosyltransferase involved in cell wall biosynthesis